MVLALACALWALGGLYGVFAYGHDYWVYRGFAPPRDPPGIRHGQLSVAHFWSPALHSQRSYLVYLPPGYAAGAARGRRFPVLYLLHGSPGYGNLFFNAAGIGVALDDLVTRHRVPPFLIVAPAGGDGTFEHDTEWADTRHGPFETLAIEAVQAVDARWSTLPDRRDRAIAGNSEGAYGALNIALRHPGLFSIAEGWSGYFTQVGFSGPFAGEPRAVVDANSPSFYVPAMAPIFHALPFHAFLYSGRDERAASGNAVFAAELRRAGADASFATVSGGHDWELWRQQAPAALAYVGRLFGSATR